MQPNQLYSGNATADRRADYARMLDDGGDPASAAELIEQALELADAWPAFWFQLAEYREKAGDRTGAIAALRQVLVLDADDVFGVQLKLASFGASAMPDHPSSIYLERMFDDYADRFEHALLKKLAYSVPRKLAELLGSDLGADPIHAVDLGCGTGLFGVEIRNRVAVLEGFDLSANMLAKAEAKHIYDLLAVADLSLPADACGLFANGLARHRASLVGAADVMIYLGNLDPVFSLVRMLLNDGGRFVFSVEDSGTENGFQLAPTLRYVHSEAYVRAGLAHYGFTVEAISKTVIRMDSGNAIRGILFVAAKTA